MEKGQQTTPSCCGCIPLKAGIYIIITLGLLSILFNFSNILPVISLQNHLHLVVLFIMAFKFSFHVIGLYAVSQKNEKLFGIFSGYYMVVYALNMVAIILVPFILTQNVEQTLCKVVVEKSTTQEELTMQENIESCVKGFPIALYIGLALSVIVKTYLMLAVKRFHRQMKMEAFYQPVPFTEYLVVGKSSSA